VNKQAQDMWDLVSEMAVTYGMSVLGAIVILILGLWFAGFTKRSIKKVLNKSSKMDQTVSIFISSLARYAVIAVTILAVLDRFGFETTSLVALIGAMGLAVGLALQGTLSNVAAGVMLLIFRPFKVGEFVDVAGSAGTVKAITLFTTEMDTGDNVRIIIPNASIWGSNISNFSFHDKRRIQLMMSISYDDDMEKARRVIEDVIKADTRSHKDPEPMTAVTVLGASSVDIMLRVWCDAGDFWPLQWDLTQALKRRFDEEGISIPYPHMVMRQGS
jgi:small conductance mechanosensitive channel